jgi:putative ABC transport system permease protein
MAGIAEIADIVRTAVRGRLGVITVVTGGRPPGRDRDPRGWTGVRLTADLRLALRHLRAAKLPAAIALVTLALGIGVTSAVFSILDAMVLRPAPFAHADRLVEIWNLQTRSGVSHPGFSRALLREWRAQSDLFDAFEGYDVTTLVDERPEGAEMMTGVVVTPELPSMLGMPPLRGRLFTDDRRRQAGSSDPALHAPAWPDADAILISERLWRERWHGRAEALGASLRLSGRTYTIAGIMPAAFRFPNDRVDFWLPTNVTAASVSPAVPSRLVAFARLRPGVPEAQAAEAVRARGGGLARAIENEPDRTAMLHFVGRNTDRTLRTSLFVLAGAAVFLLLIVCANLASLSLSRALERARDNAVRASCGASRADLVRALLVEHLLLGAAGVAAGLVVAAATLDLTVALLPDSARLSGMNAIDLDARALAFTGVIGMGATVLFGLPPAWLASRPRLLALMRHESRSATGSRAARRLRHLLVTAEVTLAIVLLVGAALMARSFVKLQQVDRGFDTRGLVRLRVGLPRAGYADPSAQDQFADAMVRGTRRLDRVQAATSGAVPPEATAVHFGLLELDARPGELLEGLTIPAYTVWPNYFTSLGIPIVAGRAFAEGEPLDSLVLSESAARRFWPGESAIGRRLRFEGGRWLNVVGVAGEVRQLRLDDREGSFEFYYPQQRPASAGPPPFARGTGAIVTYLTFVARSGTPEATLASMRRLAHDIDPRVVVWRADVVDRLFGEAVARPRLVLLLMSVFGGVGLVLAAAGIYGVLSYLVVQRRREIGVRLALGAEPVGIATLVLRQALTLAVAGVVLGIGLSFLLLRIMRALLYEVEPTDPLSLAAVSTLLLFVALVAAWPPARRARRIDPASMLREG